MDSSAAPGQTQSVLRAAAFGAGLAAICGVSALRLDSRPVLVGALLVAAAALALGAYALRAARVRLDRPASAPQPDRTAFGPRSEPALLELEARLEFAPVALWAQDDTALKALNAAARRMSAPGQGVDARALLEMARASRLGQRTLVTFDSERGHERAVLATSELLIAGRGQRLLALMPIESELEAQTLNAWRQLAHVLTHEIMNSLTPIASLSQTALDMVGDLPSEARQEVGEALHAIARRSTHLAQFVARYRSISQLPDPVFETFTLKLLFDRLARLVAPGWQSRGGSTEFSVEPQTLEMRADPGQLEQALLNLIQNAAQATADVAAPRLRVAARMARGGRLVIEVTDNGIGVPAGLESQIFTPFFTTRKNGSGIGLALVRDQVHAMGGTVRYSKLMGGGACFVLAF